MTDHGRPIARIVPISLSPFERLVAEGEYVAASTTKIFTPPIDDPPGRPSGKVLDELRSDRL
ncbi:hypothetical protein [Antribacter soli]|uniref:hypothetical protein n=1 Tax=Antribacter soli TaxID=2910976 RepID=UPI001F4577F2|nr:hypothetical protein [Antribacter soli]